MRSFTKFPEGAEDVSDRLASLVVNDREGWAGLSGLVKWIDALFLGI